MPRAKRKRTKGSIDIHVIEGAMLQGLSRKEMLKTVAKCSTRQLDRYIRVIKDRWIEAEKKDSWPTRRARQLRRLYASIRYLMAKQKLEDVARLEQVVVTIEGAG